LWRLRSRKKADCLFVPCARGDPVPLRPPHPPGAAFFPGEVHDMETLKRTKTYRYLAKEDRRFAQIDSGTALIPLPAESQRKMGRSACGSFGR